MYSQPTHADIAADGIQHSAERNRRVILRGHENLRDHGCGRGLSVGAGNRDGIAVMLHYLSQKGLAESISEIKASDMCFACFDGVYPEKVPHNGLGSMEDEE